MATVKQVVEFTSSDVIRILSEAASMDYGINDTDRATVRLLCRSGVTIIWNSSDTTAAVLEVATVQPHNKKPQ